MKPWRSALYPIYVGAQINAEECKKYIVESIIPAGTADADTVKTMTIMKMQRNLEAIADLPV